MGTDIHMLLEVKRDGAWVCIPPTESKPEFGIMAGRCHCHYETAKACPSCGGTDKSLEWYGHRNYTLFYDALGKNGCDELDCETLFHDSRGMPKDASDISDHYELWEHSFSWGTLAELLAIDWERSIEHSGVIPVRDTDKDNHPRYPRDDESYQSWRIDNPGYPATPAKRSPRGYCGGGSMTEVSTEQADRILAGERYQGPWTYDRRLYTRVAWMETLRHSCQDFLEFLEYLKTIVPDMGFADVRLIWGYDS